MSGHIKSLLLCFFLFSKLGFAQTNLFETVMQSYSEGKYRAAVEELDKIEKRQKEDPKTKGLIAYWKAMSLNRLQDYPAAIEEFKKAIALKYEPKDLHYELGQALFASEKLIDAKIYFNESFKRSFKRGTCLYYMAFISKELGQKENAETLFTGLVRLEDTDALESRQAAQIQLGDMALESVEVEKDALRKVEYEVIPMYEKALKINPESPLSGKIKEKIKEIQKKYNLVLFQLRNGRPTQYPPYFFRAAQEFGFDTNVTFAPTETTISKARQSSTFSKTEVFGRYTYYYKDFLSYSPELRFNNQYYFNRVPEIYRNDNYLIAPGLRTSHEHTLWGNPASFHLDYEFNEARRDVNAKKKLEFSSRSHTLTIGEKFKFFSVGETALRLRQRFFESFLNASDSKATGVVMEQILGLPNSTLLIYSSLDFTRVKSKAFDTNALMIRADWLLPKYKDLFTPSLGMGLTITDPINNRQERGTEALINPSLRLSRDIGKNWKLNSRFEHQTNNSKDKTNFAFKKNLLGLEAEYLY